MKSFGVMRIQITCADISAVINDLLQLDIIMWDIEYIDELTAFFVISVNQITIVKEYLERKEIIYEITKTRGIFWLLRSVRRRVCFVLLLFFMLLLTVWTPSKVLFFEVKGCQNISVDRIIETAVNGGLVFGCKSADVKSNVLKNILLEQIQELEWVGITIRGCVAVIEVQEVTNETEIIKPSGINHIVAVTDGLVESVTVEQGTGFCLPGQAVYAGQILISGYEDCGICLRATGAAGEINAYTFRKITAQSPSNVSVRAGERSVKRYYSVIFGKKQINFFQDSRISPTSCVKMYSRKYITLPGGFQLPVALVEQTVIHYDTYSDVLDETSYSWVDDYLHDYMTNAMIAGRILNQSVYHSVHSSVYIAEASYSCLEQIGKNISEENLLHHG